MAMWLRRLTRKRNKTLLPDGGEAEGASSFCDVLLVEADGAQTAAESSGRLGAGDPFLRKACDRRGGA